MLSSSLRSNSRIIIRSVYKQSIIRSFQTQPFKQQQKSAATTNNNVTIPNKNVITTPYLNNYKKYYQLLQTAIQTTPDELVSKSPKLVSLHHRLNLPLNFKLSTLSRCLNCRSSSISDKSSDNHGLNILGKNLLTFYVTEHLMKKYPRLPTVILNAAIDAYISSDVLYQIGKHIWGIELENDTIMNRYLSKEPIYHTLGKLRFYNNILPKEKGIEVIKSKSLSEKDAYGLAVRSIIAGIYIQAEKSPLEVAEKFISEHILSRKLDVSALFQFEQPTRELAVLCHREGLQQPISRLLAENGRLSKAPLFIVGVFSGGEELGQGYGSSLKEAKARAATDALLKWYCYEPTTKQAPVIDAGPVIV
ncbi:related to 54S ribosomal protein L3, mitochondrial [Saccharomycodes ludwigii]|uniref:Large ribosomal subunit protein mL44 n=1 Tax=Saccharomycodes ludwigii TaxID=36035 RepID=A0A376B149_9ASCO|nr:hypothetical protein SCDLUD_004180 [Saccharomycodes ludwigii]KAH3899880.1 hypothetical protein SCDLUD_004180 [Saccharomycodes ludwigii]SSD58349.1 related to 54S ribosomal protein L3, mitochondrial [Saccharomycodes ludwigii]